MPPARRRSSNPCAVSVRAAGHFVKKRCMKANVGKTEVMVFERGESMTEYNILIEAPLRILRKPRFVLYRAPLSKCKERKTVHCLDLQHDMAPDDYFG
ncbi:hypothetical protein EVAR_27820_1 [Eumeta japonica]|uniref:Uncharacterized protein n=1 Tax=Eumeta variegata TaxID=151549 RepID=A0A4C1VL89_EUMVA|nr:hypothetical protein EVAR_27820_1 [Eumeta japonica]